MAIGAEHVYVRTVDRVDLDAVGVVVFIADDKVHAGQRHRVAEIDERRFGMMVCGDRVAKALNKAVVKRAYGAALAPIRQGVFGGVDRHVAKELYAVGVVGQLRARDGLAKAVDVLLPFGQVRRESAVSIMTTPSALSIR